VLEDAASKTLFPYENYLVIEGNSSCNVRFSRWGFALFVPNRPVQ
jgi:hypothetical protein